MAPEVYPMTPEGYPMAPEVYPMAPDGYPMVPVARPMGMAAWSRYCNCAASSGGSGRSLRRL